MEIVYLGDIDKRSLQGIENQARYNDLVKKEYRWNWKIIGSLMLPIRDCDIGIRIDDLTVQFSENAGSRYKLIPPHGECAVFRDDQFKLYQQKWNETDNSGDMCLEFSQHLHTFKIANDGKEISPDQQFWQHMRNFFGHSRVLDPSFQSLSIDIGLRVKFEDGKNEEEINLRCIGVCDAIACLQEIKDCGNGIIKRVYRINLKKLRSKIDNG